MRWAKKHQSISDSILHLYLPYLFYFLYFSLSGINKKYIKLLYSVYICMSACGNVRHCGKFRVDRSNMFHSVFCLQITCSIYTTMRLDIC